VGLSRHAVAQPDKRLSAGRLHDSGELVAEERRLDPDAAQSLLDDVQVGPTMANAVTRI
jgi:hypothetical protein